MHYADKTAGSINVASHKGYGVSFQRLHDCLFRTSRGQQKDTFKVLHGRPFASLIEDGEIECDTVAERHKDNLGEAKFNPILRFWKETLCVVLQMGSYGGTV